MPMNPDLPPERPPSEKGIPLWAWPMVLWLLLLAPAAPLAIYAVVAGGPNAVYDLLQTETMLCGIALALSLFLALVTWFVRLFRR
jgi:hypothetical protein